jgi:hypothetical protein
MSYKIEVLGHLFCSYEECFKKLPKLLLVIKKLNPETVVDWTQKENLDDKTMVFRRVFFVI